jgi:predicted Rossmann-fold nucleotide-binding protein
MPEFNLPYQPIRQQLYTRMELFQGFQPDEPASWGRTLDFAIYTHFVRQGRGSPANPYIRMMQALHDNTISQSTTAFVAGRKVAAIMGDHLLARDSAVYRELAVISRRLVRSGILLCTGGGPGAMEAAHLGATLAAGGDADLDGALAMLKTQPTLPALRGIVNSKGAVDPALVAQAHAWFKPAYEIAESIHSPGSSLAIPTWQYGQEPSTPLATHIAKYFQNSIREDGLLALARQGILFSEGKVGTIQEIFQDSAQNYYKLEGSFSPMVLFGIQYWTTKHPVVGVLQSLFTPADFAKHILVTDEIDAAVAFIEHFAP